MPRRRATERLNIKHLREHGPSLRSELPNMTISTSDRAGGVERFRPPTTNAVSAATNRGIKSVYYLRSDHEPVQVVGKWLDEHPKERANLSPDELVAYVCGHSPEWKSPALHAWSKRGGGR